MPRKKKSHLIPAVDVLQSLLQDSHSPVARQFTRWKLWHSWEEVVGQTVANYTTPMGYFRGQLYIWVKHPTYMQELIFVTSSLKNKINRFIGRKWVQSIRLTLNRSHVPEKAEMSESSRKFLSQLSTTSNAYQMPKSEKTQRWVE